MRICSVEGCNNKHLAKGYCDKHYRQIKKYGEIIRVGRTTFDPNEIVMYKDYAEIILYNDRGMEVARALIDIEDVERVSQYKWSLSKNGYVRTTINGKGVRKGIKLHRFIMNVWQDEFDYNSNVIDHINRNKLDNRKSNLRITSQAENNENRDVGKKVIAIIDNKPFMTFDTIRKGAECFGIKGSGNISNCCNSRENYKTCGKYNGKPIVWKFLFVEEL